MRHVVTVIAQAAAKTKRSLRQRSLVKGRGKHARKIVFALGIALWFPGGAKVAGLPAEVNRPEPDLEALRRAGFEALYSLDYEAARRQFQRIIEARPDHPMGYLYLATTLWVEKLNQSRRLQTGFYLNPSFYAATGERIDPERDRHFRRYIEQAMAKADALLAKRPDDVEAKYFRGAASAILGAYEASVARRFFAALRAGSRAVKDHREILARDPGFADAYLTVGIYDYIVGSLPLAVRLLAALGGFRGDRQRGLAELEHAAASGKYVADDARVLLVALYYRERRYSDALAVLETLASRYPRNYLLRSERATLLLRLGRTAEAVDAFEQLLRQPSFSAAHDVIRFQYAEALFQTGYTQAALHHFRQLVASTQAYPDLVTLSYLRIGQILDLSGNRSAALTAYTTVLERENVFDSHEQARRYRRTPYKRRE